MTYFQELQELLKIEQAEDHLQYTQLTEKSSVQSRRENGLTWYPVAIRGTDINKADYITVELERTTHKELAHQMRNGMPAILFSNHQASTDKIQGTITHCFGNTLKLQLKTDELPDWANAGKLGVDVLFDNNSYDEMNKALQFANKNIDEASFPLIKILTGNKTITSNELLPTINIPSLNIYQLQAVRNILCANELAIVHGPPGTGKTTTLVQAILAIWQQTHQQILVVAPSNTAVDLLSLQLHLEGLNVVRIGNPAKVSEELLELTLDAKTTKHKNIKEIKALKKQAQEFKNMAHKYKRSFGKSEREQRKLLFDEAYKIMKSVEQTEKYITDDILTKAQVITATLVGANHYTIQNRNYQTLVIDEAGQALEPATWIPILKANKIVLAGDYCQLPPTIKSYKAASKGLNKTLLEKCITLHPNAVTVLQEQYRMNEKIMQFSSSTFYENKLIANAKNAHLTLFANSKPLEFLDTAGCGFEEKLEGSSTTNTEEAVLLLQHVTKLCEELETTYTLETFPTFAIISPYKQQIIILQELFLHNTYLQKFVKNININTIDSFQGQERDVVYISLVRSNSKGEIGFLADTRRMNVAMTRARKKLVIIGDSATLAQHNFYQKMIDHAQEHDAYVSAWEYMQV